MSFKKGCTPWNKGKPGTQIAWNKGKIGVQVAWNKGKQLSESHREALSLSHQGKRPWRKGKVMSSESIEKMRASLTGRTQSIETRLKRGKSLLGKRAGANCNLWKGGINPLRMAIRDLSDSSRWRKRIFKRDKYVCQFCKEKGGYLEAHHLKPFKEIYLEFLERYSCLSPMNDKALLLDIASRHDPFWNIDNGVTLCRNCHDKTKGV